MMTRAARSQARYLSQAAQLEEAGNPAIIRHTMAMVSAAVIAFVAWAGFTDINEIAHAPGEVVPQGFEQVVQHFEGGMVRSILVREGEKVQKDAVLMELEGGGVQEDLARSLSRQQTLEMQEERLRSFAENRAPDFTARGAGNLTLKRDQAVFFESMAKSRDEERGVIREQIRQKERVILMLQAELDTAHGGYAIAKDLYERRAELNRKGYTSDVQYLQARQALNSIEGDMKQTRNKIAVAQAEIGEFRNRLTSLDAKYIEDANERLDALLAEKAQNAEAIAKLQGRAARLKVRAPVRGFIKGLAFNTVGSVVQPGQTLMEIVPLDEQLIVQTRIPPQHIGHLKPGQRVQVKFSSFDFSRYGFVKGTLEQISAATFTGEHGERYYRGRIKLDAPYVGGNPRNEILPGMTVMVDIVTGEKTILEYLLKPIHVAMKTAFTER